MYINIQDAVHFMNAAMDLGGFSHFIMISCWSQISFHYVHEILIIKDDMESSAVVYDVN